MLFEIIFLSAGIFLIGSAITGILRNVHVKKTGISVTAAIVDIRQSRRAGKNKSYTLYCPIFEYRVDGKVIKTKGPASTHVPYSIGSVTEIQYDPKKPNRIVTQESPVKGHVTPCLIGGFFVFGSVLSMTRDKPLELKGFAVFFVILLVVSLFAFIIIKALRAYISKTKRDILEGRTANNVLVAAKKDNNTVVFEFVNGNRISFEVPESVYKELCPKDRGTLTFKNLQFINFERTYRQKEE
ncbi:MAG: DUF2500 family protein [Clostridia bacterium]|jgi:sorbitol-specific phosphotransferase system component IIC